MARINRRLPVALRPADWDTVLALLSQANLPEGDKTANLRFLAAELSDFATGMKALDNNDAVAAEAASDRMDAGLWRTKRATDTGSDAPKKNGEELAKKIAAAVSKPPADPISPDAIASPLIQALSVASLELHAGVLIAKGKLEQGKKEFASAIAAEKDLGYHEPPMYIRPVGENEAVALIRAKDYDGAKAAYEDALKERPNSGFALYGLALVRELAGDAPGARESYQAFLKAWSTADPTLPEVVHARKIVADTAVAAR
jgi:tetratricopeptide (TPR) repeat protein